jgi:hypothetical protein
MLKQLFSASHMTLGCYVRFCVRLLMKFQGSMSKVLVLSLIVYPIYGCERECIRGWVQRAFPQFSSVIGEGGQGIIFGSEDEAMKVCSIEQMGDACQKEYLLHRKAYDAYMEADNVNNFKARASIVRPSGFSQCPISQKQFVCYLQMARLLPIDVDQYRQFFSAKAYPALLHILLGNNTVRAHIPTQGLFLGYKEVESFTNQFRQIDPAAHKTNMQLLCWDLGRLLAIMHLKAKISPYDCEFVLARQRPDVKTPMPYQLYVIDFGKAKDVSEYLEAYFKIKSMDAKGKFYTVSSSVEQKATHLPEVLEAEIAAIMKGELSSDWLYIPTPDKKDGFTSFMEGYITYAQELANKQNQPYYINIARDFLNRIIAHEKDGDRKRDLLLKLIILSERVR